MVASTSSEIRPSLILRWINFPLSLMSVHTSEFARKMFAEPITNVSNIGMSLTSNCDELILVFFSVTDIWPLCDPLSIICHVDEP